jgi:hypothetical protein
VSLKNRRIAIYQQQNLKSRIVNLQSKISSINDIGIKPITIDKLKPKKITLTKTVQGYKIKTKLWL